MKLIKPSVDQITETNPFKKVEIVGRTCYKSSSAMTEETARKFFKQLSNRKHYAMLEHATFVFMISKDENKTLCEPPIFKDIHTVLGIKKFRADSDTKIVIYDKFGFLNVTETSSRILISGNLRAIIESGSALLTKCLYHIDPELVYTTEYLPVFFEDFFRVSAIKEDFFLLDPYGRKVTYVPDLFALPDLTKEEFLAHAYFSFHFVCDRGVTHEMVRHRPMSFAQESTRYCNYSKDQFGHEISCITPAHFDEWDTAAKRHFIWALKQSEKKYFYLLEESKRAPQEARAVLPNALKTEIICTSNAGEWEHFFNLRSRGLTGAPHPDMKVVADMALAIYEPIASRYLTA